MSNLNYIVSGSNDSLIKIWNIYDGKCIKTLAGHTSYINDINFSPDEK